MGSGRLPLVIGLLCIAPSALVACSSGEELDVLQLQRQAVQREYGIKPAEMVDLPDGSRLIFFGDSITAGGVGEDGYVTLVADALESLYPGRDIDVLGSGVVGDKVPDLGRRLRRDVLARKPTHVVIYVGVNDAASLGPGKTALSRGESVYRQGLADLVTRIRDAGAWVMICTPGVIGEDVDEESATNQALERYSAAAREVAAEHRTGLCDLRSEFTAYLANRNHSGSRGGILTVDGLHLNPAGNRLVAGAMLRALVTQATPVPPPERTNPRGNAVSPGLP